MCVSVCVCLRVYMCSNRDRVRVANAILMGSALLKLTSYVCLDVNVYYYYIVLMHICNKCTCMCVSLVLFCWYWTCCFGVAVVCNKSFNTIVSFTMPKSKICKLYHWNWPIGRIKCNHKQPIEWKIQIQNLWNDSHTVDKEREKKRNYYSFHLYAMLFSASTQI